MKPTSFTPVVMESSRRAKMIRLSPIHQEECKLRKPDFIRRERPQQSLVVQAEQHFVSIYLWLTSKDSLAKCPSCSSRNERRTTITIGFKIDPKNPDRQIIQPRLSNAQWILSSWFLRLLLAPPSYDEPMGWCLIEQKTKCTSRKCNKCSDWEVIHKRTGYRKFPWYRWVTLLLQKLVKPWSICFKRASKPVTSK